MARYFIEVSYKGTAYSGFQVQENARTIQSELEAALETFYRQKLPLTGSSRTDAGVHARQNYFHTDTSLELEAGQVYNLNAILPPDIAVQSIRRVRDDAHSRFHASSREYCYYIYTRKDPFLNDRAWFYPYALNREMLEAAAALVKAGSDFSSFSKRNTQVKTYNCTLYTSVWEEWEAGLVYRVRGNRFLRGMVRALVATMLKVGRGVMSLEALQEVMEAKDCRKADFSAPSRGLFLVNVEYPQDVFIS